MRFIVGSVEAEYRRYKFLAEEAFSQLSDAQLAQTLEDGDNSAATIAWHIAGNLRSRFTDFLSTDGEKAWRDRESEFLPRHVARSELVAFWDQGWKALWSALADLTDDHLERTVSIRGQSLSVAEALHRSLAHVSYHVGQVIFIGKHIRGAQWNFLSIPPGKSSDYNKNPILERPPPPKG